MIDSMSYIIVRSSSSGTGLEFFETTYIQFENLTRQLENAMRQLLPMDISASNEVDVYATTQPPYVVLNRLASAGFKVVGANSIADSQNRHWQIWTLNNL